MIPASLLPPGIGRNLSPPELLPGTHDLPLLRNLSQNLWKGGRKLLKSPGEMLLASWNRLERMPGGRWLFNRMLARRVPYSGSIDPQVEELRPRYARVTMRDRRAVRNHLNSIHAIALTNLGEVTSGLAMITALPAGTRSIVTGLSSEFLKKGRGRLTAECSCEVPSIIDRDTDQVVTADITDDAGDLVARVEVRWRLRPAVPDQAPDAATAAPPI
jgi:acyl-coenzyme A thioesterase PaaI-like protein